MSSQAWTPIHQSQVTTTNAKKLFWNRPSSSLLRRLLQYWPYWILLFFLLLLLKSLGATQLLYFANSSNTSSWLYVATFRLSILRLFTAPKTLVTGSASVYYSPELRVAALPVDENTHCATADSSVEYPRKAWNFFISATLPLDFPAKRAVWKNMKRETTSLESIRLLLSSFRVV